MRRLASTSRHRPSRRRRALFLEQLEDRRVLATFTVNTVADTVDADPGITSLREAITAANNQAGNDIINFSVTGTINLTGALPDLSSNIEIQGPGAANLTVRRDTGGDYRIFTVVYGPEFSGTEVVLDGLRITRGTTSTFDSGGGGIYNRSGTLTISNCIVYGNHSENAGGGGISNDGSMLIINSTVSENHSTNDYGGGGIDNRGTLTVRYSTVSNNHLHIHHNDFRLGGGGGIRNRGQLNLSDSTLSDNYQFFSERGAGIFNAGEMKVNNSTLSGNYTAFGDYSSIFHEYGSNLSTISNSTVLGRIVSESDLDLSNSIIDSIFTFAPLTGSHNLIADGSGGLLDTITDNPNLGPLANNGGPTRTHALLVGSAAINAGDNTLVPPGVTTDQRGLPRFSGTVDIGAFEFQLPVQSVTVDIRPESLNVDSNGTLSVVIFGAADFNAAQINVGSVRFAGAGVWQSTLADVNHDGRLDLQVKFRTQDTILDEIYADLLLDDVDADGILDSTRQSAQVDVTGQTLDDALFSGSDNITLFLAGRSLRNLLDELFGG